MTDFLLFAILIVLILIYVQGSATAKRLWRNLPYEIKRRMGKAQ